MAGGVSAIYTVTYWHCVTECHSVTQSCLLMLSYIDTLSHIDTYWQGVTEWNCHSVTQEVKLFIRFIYNLNIFPSSSVNIWVDLIHNILWILWSVTTQSANVISIPVVNITYFVEVQHLKVTGIMQNVKQLLNTTLQPKCTPQSNKNMLTENSIC